MNVQIRDFRREDVEPVANVFVRSWQTAYKGIVPQAYLDTLENSRWSGVFAHNFDEGDPHHGLVLLVDDKIVGATFFRLSRDEDAPEHTGEVASLYLLPEAWGKGLGTRLLTEALTGLFALGFARCWLWTLRDNLRAQATYERLGFRRDGAEKDTEIGGEKLQVIRFVRDLPHA